MVRSKVIAAIIVAVASLTAVAPASAQGYYVDSYAYVVGVDQYDVLNIRRWPAPHSQKIGAIPPYGEDIYVQRCNVRPNGQRSDWCKINYNGTWGWVSKRFIVIQ
ncbi:MAG: SH3 domain-containing protein [Pseudomonadota bacterium]